MEFLQNLLESSQAPIISAIILGLMTAISPCPLATNITAIAFISKDIEIKKRVFYNGLIYTLGRIFSYTTLGLILFFGASKFHIARLFQSNGEKIVGPLLIIIGIFMLGVIKINFPAFREFSQKIGEKGKKGSYWNVFLLGVLFALAFCPYSGVLYFGMLIPITISSASGLYLPVFYAIATALPVILFAYILAFSVSGIGNFYKKIQTFQKWLNKIVAIIFIAVGIYYCLIFYVKI